ncbi:hypothetical protein D3C85_1386490 [compost metagenome]
MVNNEARSVVLSIRGAKISKNAQRESCSGLALRSCWACSKVSDSLTSRRITSTNSAGTKPIMNSARHASSGGRKLNNPAYSNAVSPQPNAQPACTMPTALPRSCERITSPISTAPAVHSPPKPKPIKVRATSNCS